MDPAPVETSGQYVNSPPRWSRPALAWFSPSRALRTADCKKGSPSSDREFRSHPPPLSSPSPSRIALALALAAAPPQTASWTASSPSLTYTARSGGAARPQVPRRRGPGRTPAPLRRPASRRRSTVRSPRHGEEDFARLASSVRAVASLQVYSDGLMNGIIFLLEIEHM